MAKKTVKKMLAFKMHKKGKPWEVWCQREGYLKSFAARSEASAFAKSHSQKPGHPTTVIGQQKLKKALFT
jgi:hypothetical protein